MARLGVIDDVGVVACQPVIGSSGLYMTMTCRRGYCPALPVQYPASPFTPLFGRLRMQEGGARHG